MGELFAVANATKKASETANGKFAGSQYQPELQNLQRQNLGNRQNGRTPAPIGQTRQPAAATPAPAPAATTTPAASNPRRRSAFSSSFFDGPSVYSQPNAPGRRSLLGDA